MQKKAPVLVNRSHLRVRSSVRVVQPAALHTKADLPAAENETRVPEGEGFHPRRRWLPGPPHPDSTENKIWNKVGDASVLRALLPWFPKGTKEIRYREQRFIFTSVRPLRVSVRVLCAGLPTLKKRPRPWPRVFPQTVTLPRSSSLPVGSFSASGSVSSSSQGHCEIYTW